MEKLFAEILAKAIKLSFTESDVSDLSKDISKLSTKQLAAQKSLTLAKTVASVLRKATRREEFELPPSVLLLIKGVIQIIRYDFLLPLVELNTPVEPIRERFRKQIRLEEEKKVVIGILGALFLSWQECIVCLDLSDQDFFFETSERIAIFLSMLIDEDPFDKDFLAAKWGSNVLEYPMRRKKFHFPTIIFLARGCPNCPSPESFDFCLPEDVVSLLSRATELNTTACDFLLHALRFPHVASKYQSLVSAAIADTLKVIYVQQRAIKEFWEKSVSPSINSLFSNEPAPFIENFNQLLHEKGGLRELKKLKEVLRLQSCSIQSTKVAPIIVLLTVNNCLTEASGNVSYGTPQPKTVENLLLPVVTICFRHGLYSEARAVLEWIGSVSDTCVRWFRRLTECLDGKRSPFQSSAVPELEHIFPPSEAGKPMPLFSKWVISGDISLEEATDALVCSTNLTDLRFLAENIRSSSALGRSIVGNPLTVSFVLEAFSRLISLLLKQGDAPLARVYLSTLAVFGSLHGSDMALLRLLQCIGAIARCFSYPMYIKTKLDFSSVWGEVWELLESLLPSSMVPGLCLSIPTALEKQPGCFFDRRWSLFLISDQSREPPKPTTSLGTLVTVRLKGGDVHMVRQRWCVSSPEKETQQRIVLPLSSMVEEWIQRLDQIVSMNKQQLQTGTTTNSAIIQQEKGENCLDSRDKGDSATMLREKSCSTEETKKKWWEERFRLDKELEGLVSTMESDECGLGSSRLIFLGNLDPSLELMLDSISVSLVNNLRKALNLPSEQCQHLMERFSILLRGLPFLALEGKKDLATVLYHPLHVTQMDACRQCGEILATINEKVFLCTRNLLTDEIQHPSTISLLEKTKFIQSDIEFSVLNALQAYYDSSSSKTDSLEHRDILRLPREHVYLSLDDKLLSLPFEALDTLRWSSVSRIPSLRYLTVLSSYHASLPLAKSAPSSDFRNIYCYTLSDWADKNNPYREFSSFKCWTDTPSTRKNAVTLDDSPLLHELYRNHAGVYFYAGHKSGEQYLSKFQLLERFPDFHTFPTALLLGCSSAQMIASDGVAAFGVPYAYLHAGCPAFVGCLWDVTDKDIDRIGVRFLNLVGAKSVDRDPSITSENKKTIGEAIAASKGACKLKYLTGFATVIYGLNTNIICE